MVTLEWTFKCIQNALHIFLIYFIYLGDIVHRFQAKKTYFAEYYEPITELPTIYTWIRFSKVSAGLTLGNDFNISWRGLKFSKKENPLKLGWNSLDAKLEIEFEEIHRQGRPLWEYKITPLNFPPGFQKDYRFWLIFGFTEKVKPQVALAGIAFSTKNSSYCGGPWWEQEFLDGKVSEISTRIKREQIWITLTPVKYLYTKIHGECRNQPYYDILLKKSLLRTNNHCSKLCRPFDFTLCNDEYKNVTICANETESRCFYGQKDAVTEIVSKPCTKLQYETDVTRWTVNEDGEWNSIDFWVQFAIPEEVRVNEEFMIFDAVSMISAIGGTMGLCIGFSFLAVSQWTLGWIEYSLKMLFVKSKLRSCPESQLYLEPDLD